MRLAERVFRILIHLKVRSTPTTAGVCARCSDKGSKLIFGGRPSLFAYPALYFTLVSYIYSEKITYSLRYGNFRCDKYLPILFLLCHSVQRSIYTVMAKSHTRFLHIQKVLYSCLYEMENAWNTRTVYPISHITCCCHSSIRAENLISFFHWLIFHLLFSPFLGARLFVRDRALSEWCKCKWIVDTF